MDFSVIIVSWNVKDKLRANLQALMGGDPAISREVFVIDNNSADGTADMIRDEFPSVNLIVNSENFGFAKACNQGLKASSGAVRLLLNPDMKLFPETLRDLKKWLDSNPQADVAGIQLLDEDEKNVPQVRRFPNFWNQLGIVLKVPHLFPQVLATYLRSDFDYTKAAKVDSVRGAFFAIRSSALEKFGYLDERYFIWFEEVDYCRTVAGRGGEVWYTPAAKAIDYIGQSFKTVDHAVKQRYFKNSMLAYFKKWESAWQVEFLKLAWDIAEVLVGFGDSLNIKPRSKT